MTSPFSALLPALLLAGSASAAEPSWTLEEPDGLRHGWDLPHRPPTTRPDAPLVLDVPADVFGLPADAVGRGETLQAGASRVERRRGSEVVATYSGLRAWDRTGRELPTWMAVACEADAPCHVQLTVDDRQASYPITVDPLVYAGVVELPPEARGTLLPWDEDRYVQCLASGWEAAVAVVERDEHGVHRLIDETTLWPDPGLRCDMARVGEDLVVLVDVADPWMAGIPDVFVFTLDGNGLVAKQSWDAPELESGHRLLPDGDAFVAFQAYDMVYRYERDAHGEWGEAPVSEMELTHYGPLVRLESGVMNFDRNLLRWFDLGDPALGEPPLVERGRLEALCPPRSSTGSASILPWGGDDFVLTYECDRSGPGDTTRQVQGHWNGQELILEPIEGLWSGAGKGVYLEPLDTWVFTGIDPKDRDLIEARPGPDGVWSYTSVPGGGDRVYTNLAAHGTTVVALENDYRSLHHYAWAEAPEVLASTLAVAEGGEVALAEGLDVVDADTEVALLTYRLEAPAAYGTLVDSLGAPLPLGGTFALDDVRYVHDGSETTADAFDLVVCDPTDLCTPVAEVSVAVAPVNDPPVAYADALTVDEGGMLGVDLLANDTDPDDTLRPEDVQVAIPPTSGELQIDAAGLTYVHDGAEGPSDRFTYRACDPEGACAEAAVAVTVVPVNDPPVAVPDRVPVDEGGQALVDPLANDIDPDSTLSQADLTLLSVPDGATVAVVPGGLQIAHDGREPVGPTEDPPSFGYRICDDQGACADGVVELEVVPVNDPPVAASESIALDEGGEATVDVLANDTDPDDAILMVELLSVPPSVQATVVDGLVVLEHDGSEPIGPPLVVPYQVCDAAGACAAADLTVSIPPVDDPPVAADDVATVGEGEQTWVSVLANDLDPDSVLSQVALTEMPTHGTATAVAGLIEYRHDGSETTSDALVYEVCDASACSSARVELAVRPVDDLPEVVDDRYAGPSPLRVSAEQGVLANDADGDGPLGDAELVEPPLYGTVRLDADGGFVYEADEADAGSDRFVYAVNGVQGAVWLDVEASDGGCGCAGSGPMTAWWMLGLLPLVGRRRGPKEETR